MKRTKTLIKDWQNVCINFRKTKIKTSTAPEVIARLAIQCTLDKELRTEEYWRALIEGTERLGAGSQQAVNQRHQAEKLARAGDYHSAIRVLFHVLAVDPWDAVKYCEIEVMFHAMGAPAKAIKAYRRSLALSPNDSECHYRLGMAYLLGDDPCPAAIALARAITLKPDCSEAYDQLALIYRTYGYHDSAIEVLTRRLEICDDQISSVYGALACSLMYRERYEEAIEAYRQAAELAPDNADWRYDEGEALLKAGRYKEAISAYLKARELALSNANPLIGIACAYDQMGEREQSDKVIERMGFILGNDSNSLESLANRVESGVDLYEFINILLDDLRENPHGWNNLSLPAFLDALRGSLAEGYDDYYGVRHSPEFNWKALGQALLTARSYE